MLFSSVRSGLDGFSYRREAFRPVGVVFEHHDDDGGKRRRSVRLGRSQMYDGGKREKRERVPGAALLG